MSLEEFEKIRKTEEENLELFDLSIEWKALIVEV